MGGGRRGGVGGLKFNLKTSILLIEVDIPASHAHTHSHQPYFPITIIGKTLSKDLIL